MPAIYSGDAVCFPDFSFLGCQQVTIAQLCRSVGEQPVAVGWAIVQSWRTRQCFVVPSVKCTSTSVAPTGLHGRHIGPEKVKTWAQWVHAAFKPGFVQVQMPPLYQPRQPKRHARINDSQSKIQPRQHVQTMGAARSFGHVVAVHNVVAFQGQNTGRRQLQPSHSPRMQMAAPRWRSSSTSRTI